MCDPSVDNLLHLHKRKQYTAPRGANGNPAKGSGGPKNNRWGPSMSWGAWAGREWWRPWLWEVGQGLRRGDAVSMAGLAWSLAPCPAPPCRQPLAPHMHHALPPPSRRDIKKARTPAFEIPVPPGTVVKRKSNGLLLGELINPGGGSGQSRPSW